MTIDNSFQARISAIDTEIKVHLDIIYTYLNKITVGDSEDINRIKLGADNLTKLLPELDAFLQESKDIPEEKISKLRHDLRTPINIIKGYSEIILEDKEENFVLCSVFYVILEISRQILALIDRIQKDLLPLQKIVHAHSMDDQALKEQEVSTSIEQQMEVPEKAKENLVLIVDDDTQFRDLIKDWLVRKNYDVLTAGTGQEGLTLLNEYPHTDLIVLDLFLPDISGYHVLNTVKANAITMDIPVIMVSAINKTKSIAECIKIGAEDYLIKPYNTQLMEARIKASIEKKRKRDLDKLQMQRIFNEFSPASHLTQRDVNADISLIATRKEEKGRLILVVDDIETNRMFLSDWITRRGYRAITAESGPIALELLEDNRDIDVILLDVMMPDMDGSEVLKRIKDNTNIADIPVIMVSALEEMTMITTCIASGAEDYILKPFDTLLLSARISASIEKKILRDHEKEKIAMMTEEMNLAQRVQLSLLPTTFPESPHYEIFGKSVPAKEVGGDLYDCYKINDHRIAFCIGDVSGKGIPAALMMAIIRTMLYTLQSNNEQPLSDFIHNVNNMLRENNQGLLFVTLFYGILNTQTGLLQFVNAGHLYPILSTADGKISLVQQENDPALGIFENITYNEHQITLQPNDLLFLYTDGVTEAVDENLKLFGVPRLMKDLEPIHTKTPKQVVDHITQSVIKYAYQPETLDDISCLAIRYKKEK